MMTQEQFKEQIEDCYKSLDYDCEIKNVKVFDEHIEFQEVWSKESISNHRAPFFILSWPPINTKEEE